MKKPIVEDLVDAAVVRSAFKRKRVYRHTSLEDLGLDEAATSELTARLYRTVSSEKHRLDFPDFRRKMALTPKTKVAGVAVGLSRVVLAGKRSRGAVFGDDPTRIKLAGDDPTPIKVSSDVAVCATLAEKVPNLDFLDVEPKLLLGKDLKLGDAEIEEIKINLFQTLRPKQGFEQFASSLKRINRNSSVKALLASVTRALGTTDSWKL